ncbi:Tryptophan synthase alpha chain [Minicystis rosea]|nr:Tryptophan synthase alpha chain [Minicystis rosea]
MVRALSLSVCVLAVLVSACGHDTGSPSDTVCTPGAKLPCYLDDGTLGVAVCQADGKALGVCTAASASGGCASLLASCCPSLPAANTASCAAVGNRGDDALCDVYLADARSVGLCPEEGGSGEGPAYGPNCASLANDCCATLPTNAVEACLARAFLGNEQRCRSFLEVDAQGQGLCTAVDHLSESCAFLAESCCPTLPDGARDRCVSFAQNGAPSDCLDYLGSVAETNRCPAIATPPAVKGTCADLLDGCCSTIEGQTSILCDFEALSGDEARCTSFETEVQDQGFCGGTGMNGCGDTSSDVLNCGLCGYVCGTAHAVPSCAGGVCSLACEVGFGDCDGDPGNGCEVDFASDPSSCGSCFNVCGDQHAAVACTAGQCVIACDAGFGDCDGDPINGCEINLATSPLHCGACGNDCLGGVCEAMTCGLAPEILLSNLKVPSAVALTTNDLLVFGAQPLGGVAVRFSKLGGPATCLASGSAPNNGTCGFGVWSGVVVSGSEVFAAGASGISRFTMPYGETSIAANVPNAFALAIDTDSVFFTSKAESGVFKASRNATGQDALKIAGLPGSIGGALAVDDGFVYCTTLDGAVFRMDKDGKSLQQIASSQAFDSMLPTPQSLGIDEQYLFWTAQSGRIFRLKKDGSELVLLADAQPGPAGIFVEPGPTGAVYWVNRSGGTVRRMAKDGSGQTTLAAAQSGPTAVVADEVSVYWATVDGVAWKTAK